MATSNSSRVGGAQANALGIFCPKNPRNATDWGQVNAIGVAIPDLRPSVTQWGQANAVGKFIINPCRRSPGSHSITKDCDDPCKPCGPGGSPQSCHPSSAFAPASSEPCAAPAHYASAGYKSDEHCSDVGSDCDYQGNAQEASYQCSSAYPQAKSGYQSAYSPTPSHSQSLGAYKQPGAGYEGQSNESSTLAASGQAPAKPQEVDEDKYNAILGEGDSYPEQ